MEGKDLAEYILKRILGGDVFFVASDTLMSFLKAEIPVSGFDDTGVQVKLRGFEGTYQLHFIKKDEDFKEMSMGLVMGAGANFETLLGIFLEGKGPVHIHVFYIGTGFDLDKMSEMVYSLFTETGKDCIRKVSDTILVSGVP